MTRALVGGVSTAIVVAYAIGAGRWVSTDADWYRSLIKPSWQPPDVVFGLIWPYNFVMLAVAGVVGLVWKMKLADVALQQAAPIGAWMTAIALLTGAIWGKPTWGTYWVWDARLTSMLILLFLYFGVIALGNAITNRDSAAKACAVLAIVGVINIPIIKYSVEWWNTLHQGATFTLTEKPAMPVEMWAPLLLMVLGFYCFFGAVLLMRMRLEVLKREARSSWVQAEVKNAVEQQS